MPYERDQIHQIPFSEYDTLTLGRSGVAVHLFAPDAAARFLHRLWDGGDMTRHTASSNAITASAMFLPIADQVRVLGAFASVAPTTGLAPILGPTASLTVNMRSFATMDLSQLPQPGPDIGGMGWDFQSGKFDAQSSQLREHVQEHLRNLQTEAMQAYLQGSHLMKEFATRLDRNSIIEKGTIDSFQDLNGLTYSGGDRRILGQHFSFQLGPSIYELGGTKALLLANITSLSLAGGGTHGGSTYPIRDYLGQLEANWVTYFHRGMSGATVHGLDRKGFMQLIGYTAGIALALAPLSRVLRPALKVGKELGAAGALGAVAGTFLTDHDPEFKKAVETYQSVLFATWGVWADMGDGFADAVDDLRTKAPSAIIEIIQNMGPNVDGTDGLGSASESAAPTLAGYVEASATLRGPIDLAGTSVGHSAGPHSPTDVGAGSGSDGTGGAGGEGSSSPTDVGAGSGSADTGVAHGTGTSSPTEAGTGSGSTNTTQTVQTYFDGGHLSFADAHGAPLYLDPAGTGWTNTPPEEPARHTADENRKVSSPGASPEGGDSGGSKSDIETVITPDWSRFTASERERILKAAEEMEKLRQAQEARDKAEADAAEAQASAEKARADHLKAEKEWEEAQRKTQEDVESRKHWEEQRKQAEEDARKAQEEYERAMKEKADAERRRSEAEAEARKLKEEQDRREEQENESSNRKSEPQSVLWSDDGSSSPTSTIAYPANPEDMPADPRDPGVQMLLGALWMLPSKMAAAILESLKGKPGGAAPFATARFAQPQFDADILLALTAYNSTAPLPFDLVSISSGLDPTSPTKSAILAPPLVYFSPLSPVR